MAHINELYDFTVSGFIVYKQKLLLVKHKKIGKWLQPGGHIELQEDPEEALYREIEEETGLKKENLKLIELAKDRRTQSGATKILPLPFDFNVHVFAGDHKHIDLSYLFISNTESIQLETEGADDIGWFDIQQIKNMFAKGDLYDDTLSLAELALKHT